MCVCLHMVVSNTYYVVFLFCFSSSCVPNVASLFSAYNTFFLEYVFVTFVKRSESEII